MAYPTRNHSTFLSFASSAVILHAFFFSSASITPCFCDALANAPKTYNYFAFGSNMASSTMINLRNLSPLASSAAILPGHKLRFNLPGVPGVEPSSAAVEPTTSTAMMANTANNTQWMDDIMIGDENVVHGVLYKLTEEDFATVCRTEGVPFAYSLHRCRVVPYAGDGNSAGKVALHRVMSTAPSEDDSGQQRNWGVPAFTLRAARKEWRKGSDIPPSRSYLNVLIRGAEEFALDKSYVRMLNGLEVGKTWIGNGLAEGMLRRAEQRRK